MTEPRARALGVGVPSTSGVDAVGPKLHLPAFEPMVHGLGRASDDPAITQRIKGLVPHPEAAVLLACTDSVASELSRNLLLDTVISFNYKHAKSRSMRGASPPPTAPRSRTTSAVLARAAATRAARLRAPRPDEDARQGARHDRTVRHCPPRLPRPSQPEPLRTLPAQGSAIPEHNAAITTSDIGAGPLQDDGEQGLRHWRAEWMRPVGGAQHLTKPPPSSGHAGLGRGEQWASAALSGHVPHWLAVCVLAAVCLRCAKDWIRSRLRDASVNGARSRAASWGNAPKSGANRRPAAASARAVHSALYSAARPQAKTLGVVEGLSRLRRILTILLLVMSAGVHSVACFRPSGARPDMPVYL